MVSVFSQLGSGDAFVLSSCHLTGPRLCFLLPGLPQRIWTLCLQLSAILRFFLQDKNYLRNLKSIVIPYDHRVLGAFLLLGSQLVYPQPSTEHRKHMEAFPRRKLFRPRDIICKCCQVDYARLSATRVTGYISLELSYIIMQAEGTQCRVQSFLV
ncbi:hypothetical protein STEG23_036368 [Scotinomys teguina]